MRLRKLAGNKKLSDANKAKNDEFYTQLPDIEAEMRHYKDHFRGKVVLCNCDDPYESNFFKYFAMNFNFLGLKKLIATSYAGSPIAYEKFKFWDEVTPSGENTDEKKRPYKVEVTEVIDANADGAIDLSDVEYLLKNEKNALSLLEGNGDFRSPECIKLLKEADIVVTNPPFSLFREYVSQLMEYDKLFLILGSQNAITYKEIFKFIKEDKLWLGCDNGGTKWFQVPMNYEIQTLSRIKHENGIKYFSMGSVFWFTNLDFKERHENLTLYKQYNPDEYLRYDNYSAIEVSKTADIPYDYDGVMGVPITFLDKYNPEQFEILGMCENMDLYGLKLRVYSGQECRDRYFEIFGKKGVYDLNAAGVINGVKVYQRLLIKRKVRLYED
jgi:hypothetical protein